jgi:hypothetical protein
VWAISGFPWIMRRVELRRECDVLRDALLICVRISQRLGWERNAIRLVGTDTTIPNPAHDKRPGHPRSAVAFWLWFAPCRRSL